MAAEDMLSREQELWKQIDDLKKEAERDMDADSALLKLIYDDLKMRADEEGVVNISGFIWDKLTERVE